jgi:hypothetical protein
MHVEERSDPTVLAVRIVRVADETNRPFTFRQLRVINGAMEVPV